MKTHILLNRLYRHYRYRPMRVDWIKFVALRRKLIAAMAMSLTVLSGCTHTPASVVPQDGPTMQAIYTQASHTSPKLTQAGITSAQHTALPPALPKLASVVIFAHEVQVGHEMIRIPTYTVQYCVHP